MRDVLGQAMCQINSPQVTNEFDVHGGVFARGKSKLVEGDLALVHVKAGQHREGGLDHNRRTTNVVFDAAGIGMVGQIVFQQHLVDHAGMGLPVVLCQRLGQRQVEAEVGKLPGQVLEVVPVEAFPQ